MNFNHFLGLYRGERTDHVIVCHIDASLALRLGAKRGRVLMSLDTIEKQKARHPDVSEDHYRVLEPTLRQGEYRQDTDRSAQINFTDSVLYDANFRAAVKVCRRQILWVVSFNLLRDRHAAKMRRKPFPIIREHD